MSSPSSNNGDNDAWLMKIDLKREKPTRVNKDERIKKAMEDQAPAAKDILQLDHNLLTPTEIEAFKMIEIARIQNKYLTRENILLKEHIIALKGIIRKLEDIFCCRNLVLRGLLDPFILVDLQGFFPLQLYLH